MSRDLIIYYSRRGQNYYDGKLKDLEKGNAEKLMEYIQEATGADVFEILPVRQYSEDYRKCTEEAHEELRKNARPRLRETLKDIDDYDTIFVVGPCWWGTFPMPMFTQLEKLNFRGKKVFPVITHEGSGIGSAERDIKRTCKGAKVGKGLAIQGCKVEVSRETVLSYARRNG